MNGWFSIISAAVVASLVGFGGTVALILEAARAVGADAAQTASWLAALCLAMALTSGYLSVRHRIPIITAWSTPGAALIAATTGIDLPTAVGAFLLTNLLMLATAAVKPLAGLAARIPPAIAGAMLAGILLRFVTGAFAGLAELPLLVGPMLALYFLLRLWNPAAAVLGALLAGVGLAHWLGLAGGWPAAFSLPALLPVAPRFDPAVLVGLGLPLYLVSMASQNLSGFAVLRAAGYPAPARSILGATSLASLLTAPFGAHSTNMAAITAAMCAGPEAHPDRDRRWLTGPVYMAVWLLLAACGGWVVGFFAGLPPVLIATVAGVGLLAPLAGALATALAFEPQRFAAAVTLGVTASGVALLGVGAPFWGLLAGLAVLALDRLRNMLK